MTTTRENQKSQTAEQRFKTMEARQEREGFSHGYISHEIRRSKRGPKADKALLAWHDARGFDADDIYQALNSRNGRHLGDELMDYPQKEWNDRIGRSLYQTPSAMYAAFGETKESLSAKA